MRYGFTIIPGPVAKPAGDPGVRRYFREHSFRLCIRGKPIELSFFVSVQLGRGDVGGRIR